MLDMFYTLIAPRYPRHYIGRHRERRRVIVRTGPVTAIHWDAALIDLWQRSAN
jgi:hypothetical protein